MTEHENNDLAEGMVKSVKAVEPIVNALLEKTNEMRNEVPHWAKSNPGIIPPDTTGIEVQITIHKPVNGAK